VETPSQSFVDSIGNRQDVLHVPSSTTGKREVAVDSKLDEKKLFLLNQIQRKVTACKTTLDVEAKIRQPQHVVELSKSLFIASSEFDNKYQRKILLPTSFSSTRTTSTTQFQIHLAQINA
jgi:hypothetical protein